MIVVDLWRDGKVKSLLPEVQLMQIAHYSDSETHNHKLIY